MSGVVRGRRLGKLHEHLRKQQEERITVGGRDFERSHARGVTTYRCIGRVDASWSV